MAATLIFWVYILALLYCYGWAAAHFLARAFKLQTGSLHLAIVWLLGLCAVTTLGAILSLFMPLGWLAQAILLAGAAVIAAWGWRRGILPVRAAGRGEHPLRPGAWLLAALIGASALALAIGKPANPDSGIYHAQAIRWMESYPAVPGLGNLHSRLAYNSSWLLANALFSFSFLGLGSFHLMGSAIFLASMGYFFSGIHGLLRGQGRPSSWVRLAFLPLVYLVAGADVSSPGTDLPAALLAWVVLAEAMVVAEDGEMESSIRPVILVLLACFAVTVKLASLPLVLLAAVPVFHWLRGGRRGRVALLAGLSALVVLPWLARNVVLSGYLVYPFPQVDLFNFDWEVPGEIAALDRDTIRAWAMPRLPGQTDADILAMPMRRWVPRWFEYLTLNRKAIIAVVALAPLAILLAALVSRRLRRLIVSTLKPYAMVYATAYAGVLFWFFTAPLFRYGYNFTISALALAALPALLLGEYLIRKAGMLRMATIIAILLIGYQGWMLIRIADPAVLSANALLPADYPGAPTHACELHNATVWCADNWDACWYEAFPCVPDANPKVALRGDSLRQGFRTSTNREINDGKQGC